MEREIKMLLLLIRKLHILWEASRWERTARRLLRDFCPREAREAMAKAAELHSMV